MRWREKRVRAFSDPSRMTAQEEDSRPLMDACARVAAVSVAGAGGGAREGANHHILRRPVLQKRHEAREDDDADEHDAHLPVGGGVCGVHAGEGADVRGRKRDGAKAHTRRR